MKSLFSAFAASLTLSLTLCLTAWAANSGGTAWTPTNLWPEPPKNAEEQQRYELGLPPKSAIGFPDADGSPSPIQENPMGNGTSNATLSPGYTPAPKAGFEDVPEGIYYAAAVDWAADQNITKGVTDTQFNPDGTTTRGNVVTFLWRWAGETEPGADAQSFSDVRETSYCYDSVRWAVERNVTKGTTDTTFSPSGHCTYAHVLTFLWRFMGSPAPEGTGTLAGKYAGRYYQDAVLWAEEQGLLKETWEYHQLFSPEMWCPRADVVQFLYRMGRRSAAECVEAFADSSLSNPAGGAAQITMDMVTSADLWTFGTYNDRPGEHSRLLTMTEEQAKTLIWVVNAQTTFTVGGLPHGGPMKNARVHLLFNARTGGTLETGFGPGPDNG